VADGATLLDSKGNVIFANDGKTKRAMELEERREARVLALEDRKDARATAAEEARERRAREAEEARDRRLGTQLTAAEERQERSLRAAEERAEQKAAILKALPTGPAKALLENIDNLRRSERALALATGESVDGMKGDKEATGKKGYFPNQILNRFDEKGVDTRAAIADLGSMVIHDRSGAAVTASEFPRLAPFIPTEKDDAATVQKKLKLFVKNYGAIIDDQVNFYKETGYKVPVEALKSTTPEAAKKPGATPSVSALEAEMRRRGLLK
jgi:hypothetical protein